MSLLLISLWSSVLSQLYSAKFGINTVVVGVIRTAVKSKTHTFDYSAMCDIMRNFEDAITKYNTN